MKQDEVHISNEIEFRMIRNNETRNAISAPFPPLIDELEALMVCLLIAISHILSVQIPHSAGQLRRFCD